MFIIILFALINLNFYHCSSISYFPCEVFDSGTTCRAAQIFTNHSAPNFSLLASRKTSITKVDITSSVIIIWTSDVCNSFPSLVELLPRNCGVEEIEENAFSNCTKLQLLDLYNNRIKYISPNVLDKLKGLVFLSFMRNKLTDFDVNMLKGFNKLDKFDLDQNKLLEIDEKRLLENCPNLKILGLNDNKFNCERRAEIEATVKIKKMTRFCLSERCLNKNEWKHAFLQLDDAPKQRVIKVMFDRQSFLLEYVHQNLNDKIESTLAIILTDAQSMKSFQNEQFIEMKRITENLNRQMQDIMASVSKWREEQAVKEKSCNEKIQALNHTIHAIAYAFKP